MRDLVIIGGPNGAGKTTTAARLLPNALGIREFVNADNIAAGLSPYDQAAAAIPAARIMLVRVKELIAAGRSLAIETTCAGIGHTRLMSRARDGGYRVTLIFLYLDSPEIAVARVVRRVAEGGHSIPSDVIYRRYWAGLRNLLALYLPLAEVASIYDNSLGTGIPIAHKTGHDSLMILDHQRWNRLRERAHEKPDSR